jgi:hypothetical protein
MYTTIERIGTTWNAVVAALRECDPDPVLEEADLCDFGPEASNRFQPPFRSTSS